MPNIDSSFLDLSHLDLLSYQNTSVHRLDPRVKVLTTALFIVTVVSFNKYEISGLIPLIIYPVILITLGNVPPIYVLKKVLIAAPFALLVGLFNPFMDREILLYIGPVGISAGWISYLSILIRFFLTVSAAVILIATTGFNAVCLALERLGVPNVFAVQLLFLYRYIFVMAEEGSRMARARALRSFGGKGMGFRVFTFLVGQLLLRTFDRAQRIHRAMLCRGFDGEIRLIRSLKIRGQDMGFLLGWVALFVLTRLYNVPLIIGDVITGRIP